MTTFSDNVSSLTIFPELLSSEELKLIIQEKLPRLSNLSNMSHDEALSIYRSMIMPLPQRVCCSGTRNHRLLQRRKHSSIQVKNNISCSSASPLKRPSSSLERLRPPPDNASKTKIHISSTTTESRGSADKLIINDRSTVTSQKRSQPSSKHNDGPNKSESKSKKQKITWP